MPSFSRYPRNLSGLLVVGLCTFMAVFMYAANRWIAAALVCLAVFRAVVLVQDLRRAKAEREPRQQDEPEG